MNVKLFAHGPLRTNTYLLESGGEYAVIDPGQRNQPLFDFLRKQGVQLKWILVTHGHFDHMTDAVPLRSEFGGRIVIHHADAAALTDDRVSMFDRVSNRPALHGLPDMTVSGGEELSLGEERIRVMHTPGHTRGGVCFIWQDVVFSGDTLFYRNVGRVDFDGGDAQQLLASIQTLYDLPGDYRILPGHEEPTTMQEEREYNPYTNGYYSLV